MRISRANRDWIKGVLIAGLLVGCTSQFATARWKVISANNSSGVSVPAAKEFSLHAASTRSAMARRSILSAAHLGAPYINLLDGQAVTTNYVGSSSVTGALGGAQPLALASADFDGDGTPDLVSGYTTGSGGMITIHRGNVNALWPYGTALRNGDPPAFLPDARVFKVPEPPDFIGVGDFDADGHWDIVTAHLGSNAMYFLRGDGHGSFAAPHRIALPSGITAFTTGEINRADGLTDLVVAVADQNSARVLVYESPLGALRAIPEEISLPAPATALVLDRLDGGPLHDLAIAAGNQLLVVHGRDRKVSLGSAAQASVPPANITQQNLPFSVKALATGRFSETTSLAALGDDGAIHLLENSNALAQAIRRSAAPPALQLSSPPGSASGSASFQISDAFLAHRAALLRRLSAARAGTSAEWNIRADIAVPQSATNQNAATFSGKLVSAHVSTSHYDDLIMLDSSINQLHVLSSRTTKSAGDAAGPVAQTVSQPMSLTASLDVRGGPAAGLAMRLNQHPLQSLVVLQSGRPEPYVLPQAPPAIFTVTNTLDIAAPGLTQPVPPGSLRQAIKDANAVGGPAMIVFNIPITDPNRDPVTGVFLIRPLSQDLPGPIHDFSLPALGDAVTIDGYTQPGASPNTLAVGDNAKILIEINGSRVTTPGNNGFDAFFSIGTIIRGFAMTGWTLAKNLGGNSYGGAAGINAQGFACIFEGNFIGLDASGTLGKANRIGIIGGNGPLFGKQGGNIVGGTTPQARNLISGNQLAEVVDFPTAVEIQIQGNYIGTDRTGTMSMANPTGEGILAIGDTQIYGGTLPGAGNVISGNQLNLDINDLTNTGSSTITHDLLVQGNLIGTDATGTKPLQNAATGFAAILISHLPKDIIVGGTTPAARNVISGNTGNGIELRDAVTNILIQGNYIGVDVTGTKALGNNAYGIFSRPFKTTAPYQNTIGGSVPGTGNVISGNAGAGNVISGNANAGINISGAAGSNPGNTIQGNIIGLDAMGANPLPNAGNGVTLDTQAAGNIIGGTDPGAGNVISRNVSHGVLITSQSSGNSTAGNTIQFNGGAGVRVVSGINNLISRNSIFGNGALGIDLDAFGHYSNTHCNVAATGANNLQNAPVLTGGSGAAFITATATDPGGNTSEFSNAVKATVSGNILSLLGNFDSKPSTTYTIEFFSSTAADPSGFGQGQTFLTSTSVTTDATCSAPISTPVDVTQADMAVTLNFNLFGLRVGPDFGQEVYTSVVSNNGPATAHNVVFTDPLPNSLKVSSSYCNLPSCQSTVTSTGGPCTVSANTVTCNLGTMQPGASATIKIPVEGVLAGPVINTVTVAATEADPNPANNTSSVTKNSQGAAAVMDHIDPSSVLVNNPDTPVIIYGAGILPNVTTVTYTNAASVATVLPVTTFFDNQSCPVPGSNPVYCRGLQVLLPQALIGAAGNAFFTIQNPGQGFTSSLPFPIAAACTLAPSSFNLQFGNQGTTLIAQSVFVDANPPSCSWTASSSVPWAVFVDGPPAHGTGTVDFAVAPNPGAARTGTVTIAGKTLTIMQDPAATCSLTLNPPSITLPGTAGSGSVAVTASSPSCTYFVVSGFEPWVTATGLFTGNSTANFSVDANPGGPRTGAIMIGGVALPINQDAASNCFFTLSSSSAMFPTVAGTGSVGVVASLPSCAWTAATDSPSYVTITSGQSGTGNGTIQYSVAANSGNGRTATITAANATSSAPLSITQASANACAFTLSPASKNAPSDGASDIFTMIPSFDFCKFSVSSNDPTALSVTSLPTGSGRTRISYAVTKNPGTTPRTLTITAGCSTFTVNQAGAAASNPVPTVTTLQPSTAAAGSGAFTLTVNGTNFLNTSVVNFNGSAKVTTFVSVTQLTAAIPAGDVAAVGTPSVTVTNPTPGGGTSNAVTFTVTGTNPVPTITTLQPSSAVAGSGAFTLTVNGTNFIASSVVNFNGSAKVTTFVSATQLTAAILAGDVTTVGTPPVRVTNSTPGGGTSNAVNFNVIAANPAPSLTSLAPTSTGAGGAAFTLTLNGTNFISASVAQWKGSARTTTFVNATQLTAAITASDIASSGTAAVTVVNPAPGGGTSNSLTVTITDFSVMATPPTQTLPAGQSGMVTIATASVGGTFPGTVTFTTSGLPAGAAASFNPASVAAGTSTSMTVTTTVRKSAQIMRTPFSLSGLARPLWLFVFLVMLAFASVGVAKFGGRSARRLVPIGACALLLISAGYLSGCAGGFPNVASNTGTPAGTYPITVTGTSGAVQHTTTVTLVVQ